MKLEIIRRGSLAMVEHGYRRPGKGYLVGRCVGVGHQPYEHSPEGCQAYLADVLMPQREDEERRLARLRGGQIAEFTIRGFDGKEKKIGQGEPGFERERQVRIDRGERNLESLDKAIREYQYLVDNWEPRGLPQEDGPPRRWVSEIFNKMNR